jgi:hypothetical protein
MRAQTRTPTFYRKAARNPGNGYLRQPGEVESRPRLENGKGWLVARQDVGWGLQNGADRDRTGDPLLVSPPGRVPSRKSGGAAKAPHLTQALSRDDLSQPSFSRNDA